VTVTVQPSTLFGEVQAPASKSSMQRACAAALVRTGTTILHNAGTSNDDLAALDVIQKLGAKVFHLENGSLRIESNGVNPVSDELNCGESGLGVRMFTPIAALSDKPIRITGTGSLLSRPMNFFDEIFPSLGIKIETNNGKLPFNIQGALKPADIQIDGSLSSQFLTGLLMAYSAANASGVTIHVNNLKSRPYIDLTLQVMKEFGLKVPENKNYEAFYFSNENVQSPKEVEYRVEGDWSGAAFLLVAGAIGGVIDVHGIQNNSPQADKKIMEAILDIGANLTVSDNSVNVSPGGLEPFFFDATDCPDLFPPLVALAAHCQGITRIRGLKRLKHKESDRGITLQQEFEKLGVQIELNGDEMVVHGQEEFLSVKDPVLHSHHDHRIAMACAIAALNAESNVEIVDAEAINKSYPDFFKHIQSLGAKVSGHEALQSAH
jgi:3-phosphoshikimate 1-carboxyvinyltransferase